MVQIANDYPQPGESKSIIDRLGLGPDVLRLSRAGLTYKEISTQLGVDAATITRWMAKHNNRTPAEREAVESRSIFNISDRLQENFTELCRTLEEVKSAGDIENKVKVMGEIRQYLRFAADVVEKLEIIKQNEKFKEVVLELLDQEAPGIKAKALRKLQEHRDSISILRPL